MSHQKQRGKGRGATGRGQRAGYNKYGGSQNAVPHNSNMGDDYDNMCNIYGNPYLTHVAMSLLGCTVQVCVKNGRLFEGIFRAVSPKMEVTLELAHAVEKKGQSEETFSTPNKKSVCDYLIFASKDITSITAKNIDLQYAQKKEAFATDQQISRQFNNGQVNERELEPWKPHGDCAVEENEWLGDESYVKNGWDPHEMFQTNEQNFGVKSSFDKEMRSYTIPLEKSDDQEFIEREKEAARIAREIEKSKGHLEREELDSGKSEEELFSAVVRRNGTGVGDNKYIPPALRQGVAGGDGVREPDVPRQPKGQVVVNNVPGGSPKPQRVAQAKLNSDNRQPIARIVNNEPVSRSSTSPVPQLDLVTKTDRLQLKSLPPQTGPPFSSAITTSVTAVTATVTTSIAAVTSTVATAVSSVPVTVTSPSVSTGAHPLPSEQLTGERDGEKKIVEEIKELKAFQSNFILDPEALIHKSKWQKEKGDSSQKQTETEKDLTAAGAARETENKQETVEEEDKQQTSESSAGSATDSVLSKSKLNPNAKAFKFNPNAREFKPHVQQRQTPPMPSNQQYGIQQQVPISPGPSYSPSFSMQQAPVPYQGPMIVLGPQQVGQPPSGYRQTTKPFTMQPRPNYGPRDQPGDPSMHGTRVISAAAAAGSPIIAAGTPPQQIPMITPQGTIYVPSGGNRMTPQGTIFVPSAGVQVPQQVIPQQTPGMSYEISAPGTSPHFMTSHSQAGMSSSGLPASQNYPYTLSQDGTHVGPMYGTTPVQGQPHPSPSHQMSHMVFQMPSPLPSPQQVAPSPGGPVAAHPAATPQIIYVPQPHQPVPQVGAVPVSAAQLQQQPQYAGRRGGDSRTHTPRWPQHQQHPALHHHIQNYPPGN